MIGVGRGVLFILSDRCGEGSTVSYFYFRYLGVWWMVGGSFVVCGGWILRCMWWVDPLLYVGGWVRWLGEVAGLWP